MKNLKTLLFILPILFASCAESIVVKYSDDAAAKGRYTILPSRPLYGASLVMNGKLLVEQKNVKKITVENLPDGNYHYHLTCDNSRYQDKVDIGKGFDVKGGNENISLLETPPYSNGYWVNMGLYWVGSWAALWFLAEDEY